MQFTDDKDVLATLNFLMTREVAHFQQFEAALDTIQPNFPPGVLQSDPRYSNIYSNHSMGEDARGPWNEGESTGLGEEWLYVENPRQQVLETDGLTDLEPQGTPRTEASVRSADQEAQQAAQQRNPQGDTGEKPPVEPVRFAGCQGAPRQPVRAGVTPPPAWQVMKRPGISPGRSSCLHVLCAKNLNH